MEEIKYCIQDRIGNFKLHTLSEYKDDCWGKFVGFDREDDQWAYRREKLEAQGYIAVQVKQVITLADPREAEKERAVLKEFYRRICG